MADERIVAIGLLTSTELGLLGGSFDRAWPIEHAPAFPDLLRAIDEADQRRAGAAKPEPQPVIGGGRY